MKIGTKSLLFGVHQFLWHPWTVARAWRMLYGQWPKAHEWVAIACHDLGYWGKPNMDGHEGQMHPEGGARLAADIVYCVWNFPYHREKPKAMELTQQTYDLCIGHSRHYSKLSGRPLSRLFQADKLSILFDPKWFYLLRAKSSGEVAEFMGNSPIKHTCPGKWFDWYLTYVKKKFFA